MMLAFSTEFGLMIVAVLLLSIAFPAALLIAAQIGDRRQHDAMRELLDGLRCPHCGEDLRRQNEVRCPRCGTTTTIDELWRRTRNRSREERGVASGE